MTNNTRLSLQALRIEADTLVGSKSVRTGQQKPTAIAPCKVIHVELSADIPSLPSESNYVRVFVVLWWHDKPLSHLELAADQLPQSAANLRNLALQAITPAVGEHHFLHGAAIPPANEPRSGSSALLPAILALDAPLARLAERWSRDKEIGLRQSCSVVICTRNRAQQLARCLKSIQAMSIQPDEIIVVDNCPQTSETRDLVSHLPNVHYIVEPRPGLSIARNTGIRYCSGDLIAFTDDDVTVHSDWLARVQQTFLEVEIMAVTGMILPAELETEAQGIFELELGSFGWGYQKKTYDKHFLKATKDIGVPVWHIGAGANMAFRRKIFELVGTFDERLGAGAAGCSEDSEFWYRILNSGWLCQYEPTAVVFHYHRRELAELQRQVYLYMRGHATALLIQFSRYNHWGNLVRLCVILPMYLARVFGGGLVYGRKARHKVWRFEVAGTLAGIKYYWQHCRGTANNAAKVLERPS